MIDRPEQIGARLRKLRDAVGINQASMAKTLGITQSAWSQYESGSRRITLEVSASAAARFGVTLDWIYRGDPSGLPMKLAELLI